MTQKTMSPNRIRALQKVVYITSIPSPRGLALSPTHEGGRNTCAPLVRWPCRTMARNQFAKDFANVPQVARYPAIPRPEHGSELTGMKISPSQWQPIVVLVCWVDVTGTGTGIFLNLESNPKQSRDVHPVIYLPIKAWCSLSIEETQCLSLLKD